MGCQLFGVVSGRPDLKGSVACGANAVSGDSSSSSSVLAATCWVWSFGLGGLGFTWGSWSFTKKQQQWKGYRYLDVAATGS